MQNNSLEGPAISHLRSETLPGGATRVMWESPSTAPAAQMLFEITVLLDMVAEARRAQREERAGVRR